MLDQLKFVAGAINKKDIVESLSHFRIQNNMIKGFSGAVGICSPIDLDLDVTPKAEQLIKAVSNCEDAIHIHITATGKLSIRSGNFKTLVECIPNENFPEILPLGDYIQLTTPIVDKLKILKKFISEDASRPWSRGVLFKGNYLYATNNIILIRIKLDYNFPLLINVPKLAVDQLIRISEEPSYAQLHENRVTFHYGKDKWLSCKTYSNEWPPVENFFQGVPEYEIYSEQFIKDIEKINEFTLDSLNKVYLLQDGKIKTSMDDGVGTTIESSDVEHSCIFNCSKLLDVLTIADKIDFSVFPAPCRFANDELQVEGVLLGYKE